MFTGKGGGRHSSANSPEEKAGSATGVGRRTSERDKFGFYHAPAQDGSGSSSRAPASKDDGKFVIDNLHFPLPPMVPDALTHIKETSFKKSLHCYGKGGKASRKKTKKAAPQREKMNKGGRSAATAGGTAKKQRAGGGNKRQQKKPRQRPAGSLSPTPKSSRVSICTTNHHPAT